MSNGLPILLSILFVVLSVDWRKKYLLRKEAERTLDSLAARLRELRPDKDWSHLK